MRIGLKAARIAPGVPPWEPPLAGTEAEHLIGALDRLRTTFRWKADGLDLSGLTMRVAGTAGSTLTLGGLLKHLAHVEDHASTVRLDGSPLPNVWDEYDRDAVDWQFEIAERDSPARLYAVYDGAVQRARERFAAAIEIDGLGHRVALAWPDGQRASLRRLLFDLVEEYGRHTGHADLIREAVDERVGEDPPDGWEPIS